MNNVKRFEIDDRSLKVKEILNSEFLEVEFKAISSAKPNRNNSHFTPESLQNAIATCYNKPILGSFSKDLNDFRSHESELEYDEDNENIYFDNCYDTGEIPIGMIRSTDRVEIKQGLDGLYWMHFTGAIWTQYAYRQAKSLLQRANKKVSVEVAVNDYEIDEDGIEIIKDFTLNGITILGDKIETGIVDAELTIPQLMNRPVFQKRTQALKFALENLQSSLNKSSSEESSSSEELEIFRRKEDETPMPHVKNFKEEIIVNEEFAAEEPVKEEEAKCEEKCAAGGCEKCSDCAKCAEAATCEKCASGCETCAAEEPVKEEEAKCEEKCAAGGCEKCSDCAKCAEAATCEKCASGCETCAAEEPVKEEEAKCEEKCAAGGCEKCEAETCAKCEEKCEAETCAKCEEKCEAETCAKCEEKCEAETCAKCEEKCEAEEPQKEEEAKCEEKCAEKCAEEDPKKEEEAAKFAELQEKYDALQREYDELKGKFQAYQAKELVDFAINFFAGEDIDDEARAMFTKEAEEKCNTFEFTSKEEVQEFAESRVAMHLYRQSKMQKQETKEFEAEIPAQEVFEAPVKENGLLDAINKLARI